MKGLVLQGWVLGALKYYLRLTTLRGDCSTTLSMHLNNSLEKCSHKLSIINLSLKDKHMRERLGEIRSDFEVVRNHFSSLKCYFLGQSERKTDAV